MLAHITKDENGNLIEQTLADHCRCTAEYAREALEGTGFQNCEYLAVIFTSLGGFIIDTTNLKEPQEKIERAVEERM